ncbi:MAG TPA: hypothetical protein DCZ10_04815 [Pelotomaculum sp.]|nr:hypothetical protein [Pelotomaculum sp.]
MQSRVSWQQRVPEKVAKAIKEEGLLLFNCTGKSIDSVHGRILDQTVPLGFRLHFQPSGGAFEVL